MPENVWIFSNWEAVVPFCRHLNDLMTVFLWKFLTTLIISKIKINLHFGKAYSKKATKFAKNLFDIVEDFFRILLPTQNIWTLMIFLFVKNGLVIAQKKTFNQKCMQKIPKPDSHYCLLVCQVRYRTPSHELSNKKGGNGSVFFYDNIYWR